MQDKAEIQDKYQSIREELITLQHAKNSLGEKLDQMVLNDEKLQLTIRNL